MKTKKCLTCKRILVGKHKFLCSNCRRKVGKEIAGVGVFVVTVGGLVIKYRPKKIL